jgi:uncharacterized protein (UPF0332 family)
MTMTWSEIGKNHLEAAKQAQMDFPRSAASRAYYAAHVVLAEALGKEGCVFESGRQTPKHNDQAALIGKYFAYKGQKFIAQLRAIFRRLYRRRLDADYSRTVKLDAAILLDSIRDVSSVFRMLDVR